MKIRHPRTAPVYQTRAAQVAAHLKDRLLAGEWQDRLPGERILARELGVGRMTLRGALDKLGAEGLLVKDGPAGTRLLRSSNAQRERPKKVGMLMGGPLDTLHNNAVLMVDELRRILYGKNVALHLHDAASSSKRGLFPFFKYLFETLHYDGWILCGGTLEMHQWCEANRLPVVLASALFHQVHLPAVEIHFRAVCRHAVGEMVRRGHRHIALVLPRTPVNSGPGDIQSRLGFLEAVEEFRPAGVCGTVELYSGKTANLCKLADAMLARSPRPTGWLVPTPYFLTMMVHLLKNRIRVPEEVSLVCRDSEPYHQNIIPEPTRYSTDMCIKAKQLGGLVQRMLANRNAPNEIRLVMPEFLPGETLGPAPSQ